MARLIPVPRKIAHNLEVAHYREVDSERHGTTTTPTEAVKVRMMEWETTGLFIKNESSSTILVYDIQVAPPSNNADSEPPSADFVSVENGNIAASGMLFRQMTETGGWLRVMLSVGSGTVANHARISVCQKRTG